MSRFSHGGSGLRKRLRGPVAQIGLAAVIAVLVVSVAAAALLREAGIDEAVHEAERLTSLAADGIVEPNLTPGALAARPAEVERLDDIVRSRLLSRGLVRVKIWSPNGEIVYSDEPRLIGAQYELGEDELEIIESGGVAAEPSDLEGEENRFERGMGDLLEVYRPIEGPDGEPLLFESYLPSSLVAESGERIWLELAPLMIGALVVLAILQLPLAWSFAQRQRRGQREREALLKRAIDASDTERRRIAQDLHDGVAQHLAGASYALSAAADRSRNGADVESESLARVAAQTRQSLRELRTLLVDIYPPDLHRAGLGAALSDLAATVTSEGIEAQVDVPGELRLPSSTEALFYRAAQEALRNVVAHSQADHVEVRVSRDGKQAELEVVDDGRGFEQNGQKPDAGRLGLRVLADLVREAEGNWEVDSAPGRGTRVRIEVPVR
jgi:two-component system, NarL family, sensor kinase